MLQDIAPYKLNNEFLPQASLPADDASLLVLREDSRLFCRIEVRTLELPKAGEWLKAENGGKAIAGTSAEKFNTGSDAAKLRYLIAVDGCRFYMPVTEAVTRNSEKEILSNEKISPEETSTCGVKENSYVKQLAASGFSFHSARELRYTSPDWLRFGALTAWQAAGWYQANRYCGRCAAEMQPGEKERSLVCPVCGNTIYPKLCPVVIVGVIHGEQLLLTKYAGRSAYANYALVAGFAEIGETIEQTVAREVLEETGLKVKNLRYYKSQPWAYSESLLFGFFCEAEEPAEITVDQKELSLAEWTAREDIPEYEGEISLTYEMMNRFREQGRAVLSEGTFLADSTEQMKRPPAAL